MTVELDDRSRPRAIVDGGTRKAVVTVNEAWRIDDEWWRHPIARRYHDVVLATGGHVVLYEDLTTGAWFAQQP